MFWEHQVLWSSKSPQKVHKVHKRSGKWTKGTQGTQTSGSQLILTMSSNSSKGHQSPRSPQRSTKGIQATSIPQKAYQRPQNPVVVKGSSNVHQMVLTKSSKVPKNIPQKVHQRSSKGPENSSMLWDPQVRRSSKSPQKVHKVLEVLIGPQKVFKVTSNTSTIYQRPQFLSR